MITSTLTTSDAISGAGSVSGSVTDAATTDLEFDSTFGAASVNVAATLAFVLANVQSFFFLSDQNLTLKTNSSGSPADTKNLVAGVPFAWSRSAGYYAMPFSADVTSIFVSCTPAARLRAKILTN